MHGATTDRLHTLDTLRGLAVLGILVMNIQTFAMPMAAYVNPTTWGNLTGTDGLVWYVSHLLTDQKMMTLFSLLFGAGIALFTDRAAQKAGSPTALHYRRNAWLLLFGAVHAYLLWYGDVLFIYAVCAFVIYPLRNIRPARLLALGLGFLLISSLIFVFFGLSLPQWPEEIVTEMIDESWRPSADVLATEIAAYQGGWMAQMEHRVPAALEMHTFMMPIWAFWRAAGLMLIGIALYRLGVITGQAADRTYWLILFFGLPGLLLVAWGIHWNFSREWPLESLFLGWQFNYWGSLPVAMAWMAAIMLLMRHDYLPGLTRRLGAVGRMAFSNYILHTLICGLIFYGHGLGLFAELSRSVQILIVFTIWGFQLWLSPVWLKHFRFGPLEWLWRSLTYGSKEAFKVEKKPAAS